MFENLDKRNFRVIARWLGKFVPEVMKLSAAFISLVLSPYWVITLEVELARFFRNFGRWFPKDAAH